MTSDSTKIEGGCLCGEIRYEADAEPFQVGYCHCSMCRKFHGAEYATYASVKAADFRWIAGEDALKMTRSPSDDHAGVVPPSARRCGSEPSSRMSQMPESEVQAIQSPSGLHAGARLMIELFSVSWT